MKQQFSSKRKIFECFIPFLPPSVNGIIHTARFNYKSREVKRAQDNMTLLMRRAKRGGAVYAGHIEAKYTLYCKDRRRWDIDNRLKTMQDCLAPAGVIKDDSQIVVMQAERVLWRCGSEGCIVELYATEMREVNE